MKFGKLKDIAKVDFSLPPERHDTTRLLQRLPENSTLPKVYVGCTGWSMKEWIGEVYPKKAKAKDFLYHYTRQFNTIELNTTHYRIPSQKTITQWRQTAPRDFHYCPKIPQSISHSRDLGLGKSQTTVFCDAISGLEDNLGCAFMQLPPYFAMNRLALLEQFLEKFPKNLPLAVEVRHESWFNNPTHFDKLFQLLEQYQISTVITDVAGRRDVLHQRLTTDTAMVRFVGNALHPTDYERIDEWVTCLKSWFERGLKRVYFFTHEPDNLLAPKIAAYFVDAVRASFEAEIRGPKFIEQQGGTQMALF